MPNRLETLPEDANQNLFTQQTEELNQEWRTLKAELTEIKGAIQCGKDGLSLSGPFGYFSQKGEVDQQELNGAAKIYILEKRIGYIEELYRNIVSTKTPYLSTSWILAKASILHRLLTDIDNHISHIQGEGISHRRFGGGIPKKYTNVQAILTIERQKLENELRLLQTA